MSTSVVEPKRGTDVGRVVVEVTIENYGDIERADRGEISPDQIRRVKVDALVDSGATFMCLPKPLIEQCGLGETVDLRVENDCLVISPQRRPRRAGTRRIERWPSSSTARLPQPTP